MIKIIQEKIGTTVDGVWGEKSKQALRDFLKTGEKIYITSNITLNELLASNKAIQLGIDNMPSQQVLENLIDSAINLWQPARDLLGNAIVITSGFRCPKLNSAVGGQSNSAHLYGLAIDFVCPNFGNTRDVANFLGRELPKRGIKFDQAIIEKPSSPRSWVHLAYKHPNGGQRNRVFTIV